MRTSINYSSYTSTTYYAVGRDTDKPDEVFDKFMTAVAKYEELTPYIESRTEDSIMYRIPNDAAQIQMLVNKIAMISYQGCVYRDEHQKACRYCSYQNYCKVVNGKEGGNKECGADMRSVDKGLQERAVSDLYTAIEDTYKKLGVEE